MTHPIPETVRKITNAASDVAARFKNRQGESDTQRETDSDTGRSQAGANEEKGAWTLLSPGGDALDVSPSRSGDAVTQGRADKSDTNDGHNTHQRQDEQYSRRTTDLRNLDGHESWRGVYNLCECEVWMHE